MNPSASTNAASGAPPSPSSPTRTLPEV